MNRADNINILNNTNFRLTINQQDTKFLEFFCVEVNLPPVDMPAVIQNHASHHATFAGEVINYAPFNVTFLVDEEMKTYREIYDWMLKNQNDHIMELDATLSILSNQKTTNRLIKFYNIFPNSLGELQFSSRVDKPDTIECSVDFDFTRFTIS